MSVGTSPDPLQGIDPTKSYSPEEVSQLLSGLVAQQLREIQDSGKDFNKLLREQQAQTKEAYGALLDRIKGGSKPGDAPTVPTEPTGPPLGVDPAVYEQILQLQRFLMMNPRLVEPVAKFVDKLLKKINEAVDSALNETVAQ